jgi:hypothetical protein
MDARENLKTGILAWLSANIAAFDPPQEEAVTDVEPEGVMQGARRKAFGELGLALRLAHRVPGLRERPEIDFLTAQWLAMADRRNIFFDARRRIHLVPLMAVALAVLTSLGGANDSARRALQTVLDRRFLDRTERSAWTQIDIAYYLDAVGLRHAFPDPATLFRRSSLLDLPAVPHALRIDFYATTHLVFHLSDFGARDLPGASGAETRAIRRYLALALATCIAEKDWDLVGEFLAARICLGDAGDALGDAAMEALAGAQQSAGFIPDLAWLRRHEAGGEPDTPADEFAAVYHPTLVTLIMISCDLASERIAARETA